MPQPVEAVLNSHLVDLAQRLCVAFDQRFVGVEVGGRYIRIYGDDTE